MIANYLRYRRILHTLRNKVWLKTSELEAIQEKKLRAILNHAYRNVPFYHRLFDSVGVRPDDIKTVEDLSKIPITTKSQLKNAKKEIIARNIDLNNCVERATSGSTGDPLTLLFSKDDVLYVGASYDIVRIENGFKLFRDVLLSTTGESVTSNKKWYKHLGILRKEGLNVFEPLDVQIQILKKVKPDAMWGYPSAIKLLAKEVQEKNIKEVSPRLIFTASEVFDPETRDFINSVFNVDLFDVYGSWEAGGCMAWECGEHAGYHMSMDTVLMEFVDENGERVSGGERGKVVVTNLHSYAMPIIRYEIGDFAIPTDEECSCGRGGYLMKAIEGRSKDILLTSNGKIIVSSFVPYLFYPDCIYSEATVKQYQKIKQFQVIQKTKEEILIKIVKEPESDGEEFNYILTNFKNVFGENIDIKLTFVESIPPLPSGKSSYVISNINKILENTNVK
jgi:phenylacetate-CoA ligase